MAYTVTTTKTVFGNQAVSVLRIIADAATATIPTGLSNIVGMSYGPSSMNSANIHIAVNKGVSSTSIVGSIGVTGCTSGDEFYVTVYGTR